jgi:quaternary ammonium compound-resistance protein SugE
MELLFITLGGAILGLLARYTLPKRYTYGVVLMPAIGASAASLVWVSLTWLDFWWNNGLIWWLSLLTPAIILPGVTLLLVRSRDRSDNAALEVITRTGQLVKSGPYGSRRRASHD